MTKYYMNEFQYFDGEVFVTMNILEVNDEKKTVTLAVSDRGRISVTDYDLSEDENGYYFEYGAGFDKISINDFTEEK